jgi:hypothetical protein
MSQGSPPRMKRESYFQESIRPFILRFPRCRIRNVAGSLNHIVRLEEAHGGQKKRISSNLVVHF